MFNVLVVEDNKQVSEVIFEYFEALNYQLDYAATGTLGLNLARKHKFDLIILDVMLPGIDGIAICQTLRAEGNHTPIIMLTARDTNQDILLGLSIGADDYVVKPFDLTLLEARINAVMRRTKTPITQQNELIVGPLKLKTNEHLVFRNEQQVKLNPSCYKILHRLMEQHPNVVSKADIENTLWPDDLPDQDILRKHIYQLRSKIDKGFEQELIITVPKIGYKLNV